MRLSRRAVLRSMCGALAGAAGLVPARGALGDCVIESPRDLEFDVRLGSRSIGSHSIRFSTDDGVLRASTRISLKVKLGFITLLDLNHESEELWNSSRLMRLDSTTTEGSETFEVHGEAVDDGFRVESEGGIVTVARSTLTTNTLWDRCILEQSEVIDAQQGGVVGIVIRRLGEEQVEIGKRQLSASKSHFVMPSASGDLWFAAGRLVKARFEVRSEVVEYRLTNGAPESATG